MPIVSGARSLSDIVELRTKREARIERCSGWEGKGGCTDEAGRSVNLGDIVGARLETPSRNPVQIFFVGVGDANLDVGRILAESTGAEFLGTTEEDLANALEEMSGYF